MDSLRLWAGLAASKAQSLHWMAGRICAFKGMICTVQHRIQRNLKHLLAVTQVSGACVWEALQELSSAEATVRHQELSRWRDHCKVPFLSFFRDFGFLNRFPG